MAQGKLNSKELIQLYDRWAWTYNWTYNFWTFATESKAHRRVLELARLGVTILPPLPAFYNQPASIDDLVNHIVARALDQFGIDTAFARRWNGEMNAPNQSDRQPTSEATRPRIRAK